MHERIDDTVSLRIRVRERDLRALHYVVARRRPALDQLMGTVTHLGGAPVVIGLVTLLLVIGWPAKSGEAWTAAFALAVSHALVQVLKRSIARPRPKLPRGIECLVAAPDRFSFPSGHAAAALSVALGLAPALDPVVGAVVVAIALLVGVSRCYLGVHYPGDVLVGWLLAVVGIALAAPFLNG